MTRQQTYRYCDAFTVTEALVVLLILGVALMVLLPALGPPGGLNKDGVNRSQLRGLLMQITIYANSNKEWYPGVNSDGDLPNDGESPLPDVDKQALDVESVTKHSLRQSSLSRLAMENFVSEGSLISPLESDERVTKLDVDQPFTAGEASDAIGDYQGFNDQYFTHGSYAVLAYFDVGDDTQDHFAGGGLTALGELEWRLTGNPRAIVIADRHLLEASIDQSDEARRLSTAKQDGALKVDGPLSYQSRSNGVWQGAVAFNDGHVELLELDGLDQKKMSSGVAVDPMHVRYGAAGSSKSIRHIDHLFRWDPSIKKNDDLDSEANFKRGYMGAGRLVAD